jgi:hypothetical protein
MPQDNVLSLNAFGEIIEPPKKREYQPTAQVQPSPASEPPQQVIPLTRISPKENPAEISPKTEPQKEGRYSRGSKQANHVASKVLAHMSQTKLLHWQTQSEPEHLALDKLFGDLVELGDELTESVMGKYGRPELNKEESTISLTNYENPDSPDGLPKFLKNMDDCFRNECAPLFSEKTDPEIHNLIQEILGKIDKIAYLLTLRK